MAEQLKITLGTNKQKGKKLVKKERGPIVFTLKKAIKPADTVMKFVHNGARFDNIDIFIGDIGYSCILQLLRSHADYFNEVELEKELSLPQSEITTKGFEFAYAWMLGQGKFEVRKADLPQIMKAAYFLKIENLLNHCWEVLSNASIFDEMESLKLYPRAKAHNIRDLELMLFFRVRKTFLCVVASQLFLQMNVDEVCHLLQSNLISVHHEMQILLAAVLWLNQEWPKRQEYIGKVLGCVRFFLVPSTTLIWLWFPHVWELQLKRILEYPGTAEIIERGMIAKSMLESYRNHPHLVDIMKGCHVEHFSQRHWVVDNDGGKPKYCTDLDWHEDKIQIWDAFQNHLHFINSSPSLFLKTVKRETDDEDTSSVSG